MELQVPGEKLSFGPAAAASGTSASVGPGSHHTGTLSSPPQDLPRAGPERHAFRLSRT